MDSVTQTLLDHIVKNNTEAYVLELIDEQIPEYIDYDWEDEYESEYDCYAETGNGEAESDVINELINSACKEFSVELTDDQFIELFDALNNRLSEGWNV